jgi:hypothetical protein
MLLRRCAASCLLVLLCAAVADAQQEVTLQWNAAPDNPVRVDGYFVYRDGIKISELLGPTQLSHRVTVMAAVHVLAVTSFSLVAGESSPDRASLIYYSDKWLPALSSSNVPPSGSSARAALCGGIGVYWTRGSCWWKTLATAPVGGIGWPPHMPTALGRQQHGSPDANLLISGRYRGISVRDAAHWEAS